MRQLGATHAGHLSFERRENMIFKLPTLYKRDSKGKIRELTIEWQSDEPATRSIAGIKDGKLVMSGWNKSESKNEGRANATTAVEQAEKEARADWDKKVEKEYFEDITQIDSYDKFKPQLANDYTKKPQSSGISQPKLDGIRCIARKDGLYTRQGKDITTCDHIFNALKPFFESHPDAILDGELYNHELKADFNKITSLVRKIKPSSLEKELAYKLVEYHVYDMSGTSLYWKELAFWDRITIIKAMAWGLVWKHPVVVVDTQKCDNQEELDALYSKYTEQGYEGQMVRNDSLYENKRSHNLLKRKEFITEEFNVVEVLEGSGNWAGYAKHFQLELGDGRTFHSGVRGNQAVLKELLNQPVKPNWVTVRYFEKTPDGVPRFPVVIDWGTGDRAD